jgi:hypothetical protein
MLSDLLINEIKKNVRWLLKFISPIYIVFEKISTSENAVCFSDIKYKDFWHRLITSNMTVTVDKVLRH